MARSGLESAIQPEASKFLNSLGWAQKMEVEMRCKRCGTMNYPTHTGAFDYIAVIRSHLGAMSIGVEIKATPDDRWLFSSWTPEQRTWAAAWEERTGGKSYIWLQMQKGRVDAKDVLLRRRVWLVPRRLMLKVEKVVLESGVKSIPMAAHSRTKGRDRMYEELTAEALFHGNEMIWVAGHGWWPDTDAIFWQHLGEYVYPEYAKDFSIGVLHPDRAVKILNAQV